MVLSFCRYSGLGGKDGVDFAAKLKAIREKREVCTSQAITAQAMPQAIPVPHCAFMLQALEAKEAHRAQQRKELREEAAKLRKEAEAVSVGAGFPCFFLPLHVWLFGWASYVLNCAFVLGR